MKIFLLSFIVAVCYTGSIYDHQVGNANGGQIDLGTYRNKKILFVNIATGSPMAGQLSELSLLQQQYGDSLVIIGFPSNSFGNEARTDLEIQTFCQSAYGVNFLLATKGEVTGSGIQPVYQWLTSEAENGAMNSNVLSDFQKYLVNENGDLIGVFAGSVSVLSQPFIQALHSTYQ